jgi:hypothetical protein
MLICGWKLDPSRAAVPEAPALSEWQDQNYRGRDLVESVPGYDAWVLAAASWLLVTDQIP